MIFYTQKQIKFILLNKKYLKEERDGIQGRPYIHLPCGGMYGAGYASQFHPGSQGEFQQSIRPGTIQGIYRKGGIE